MNYKYPPHRSSWGLEARVLALLIYCVTAAFAFIPYIEIVCCGLPLIVFFTEKSSRLVKFHAILATGIFAVTGVLSLLGFILDLVLFPRSFWGFASLGGAFILGLVFTLLKLGALVFGVLAAIKSMAWEEFNMPMLTNIARNMAGKANYVSAEALAAQKAAQAAQYQQQQAAYNAQQQRAYGAPQQPPYGAPQQPPYGAPQQPAYGAPPQQPYAAPQQPPYNAPSQPPYGAPGQQPPYGAAPQQPPYPGQQPPQQPPQ